MYGMWKTYGKTARCSASLPDGSQQGGQTIQEHRVLGRDQEADFYGLQIRRTAENGAITFKIMFESGVLPDVWPKPRQRKPRGSKAAGGPWNIAPETAVVEPEETPVEPAS